jgi:phosphotransferase system  glucose/maltose/N-acetylglucosamine-specific IIC component
MASVQAHRHGMGHRWRKFVRQNRAVFFVFFLLGLILAVVALLFWMMTSIRFVNTG